MVGRYAHRGVSNRSYEQRCIPVARQLSLHEIQKPPLAHVCTVSTQPGSLFHIGGVPVAEQGVKKQAVPAIL